MDEEQLPFLLPPIADDGWRAVVELTRAIVAARFRCVNPPGLEIIAMRHAAHVGTHEPMAVHLAVHGLAAQVEPRRDRADIPVARLQRASQRLALGTAEDIA